MPQNHAVNQMESHGKTFETVRYGHGIMGKTTQKGEATVEDSELSPNITAITKTPDTPRPSFLTPEMIEKNPVLEAAGLFAGDPLWQELRKEIKRNRKRDQQNEEQGNK
jgi:hypothetical protein